MAALVKILTADLRQTAEADDSEPLDTFLPRTLQVLPTLVDRHTERADRFALLTEPDLRRLAKEPDQNDFVYTLRHGFVLPPHRTGTCGSRDHYRTSI
jgi:hypothetical protein